MRYCSAAVALRPDSAAAHYNLGLALVRQGKPGEGIACYHKAIEVDPKYAPPYVTLGLARIHQGKRDEAIACYHKAIEVDPKYASAYANLGNVLRDRGKVEEAAACYQKALEVDAKYAPAYVYDSLGLTRLEQGKWDEAIACFQKAITLEPKGYDAHDHLANANARLGRWDQAVGLMHKAAELKPDDPWFLYCVAPLHLQVGDRAGYRRICRAMLERFGDTKAPGVAAEIAKTCLLTPEPVADLDGVLKLADRAVTGTEKDPSYRYFLFCKGLAEYRAGRPAEAVQWLERVAPEASGGELDASAFAVLALAQHQRSRGAEALRALDGAEVIVAANLPDPAAGRPFDDYWREWLRCQVLLREAEELLKPDEARIHFYRSCRRGSQDKLPEAAAEHAPSAEAATLLGSALRHQGNLTGAIAAYRKAIELDPKYAPAQHNLGRVYAHLGQWDKAAAVVAQSLKLEPSNHGLWFQSAALRLHMGDRIGYRRACREMLARFGKTDAVYVLERTAKTCLLTPDAVTDFESVMKLADFAVKKIGSNPWIRWIQLTKALAEYRAGHVAAAIEWLQRVSPKANGDCLDATAFAALAMACQQQGQAEEARAALERGRAILAHKLPKLDKGQQFGDDWHDWLRCQILLHEAEEILKSKRSP